MEEATTLTFLWYNLWHATPVPSTAGQKLLSWTRACLVVCIMLMPTFRVKLSAIFKSIRNVSGLALYRYAGLHLDAKRNVRAWSLLWHLLAAPRPEEAATKSLQLTKGND